MTKLLNLVIVLLVAALVAVILVPQIEEGRPRTIRFVCDSTVTGLPFIVGAEQGIFADNRIIPELHYYSDPDQALAALLAGEYDVGAFPWTAVLRHIAEGGDTLRVFMSGEFRATLPVDAIVVPVKSKVKDIPGLQRQRLGYPPQLRDCIKPFLLNTGLPVELVTAVEMPLLELLPRLNAGEVDAVWLIEPLICGLDTTALRIIETGVLPRHVSAPFPGTAFGFSTDFMNENKALLSRLKLSTDAAAAFADAQPDSARAALARHLPGFEGAVACRLPELQRLVEINKPSVRALAARLAVAGVIVQDFETERLFVPPARMTR